MTEHTSEELDQLLEAAVCGLIKDVEAGTATTEFISFYRSQPEPLRSRLPPRGFRPVFRQSR